MELDNSVVEETSVTASDGKKYMTKIYNLDMVLAVGYRVKSKNAILFRKWANNILKERELEDSTCAFFAQVQKEGDTQIVFDVAYTAIREQ